MDLRQRLSQGYQSSQSRLCVGIDPHPSVVQRLADLEGVNGTGSYLAQWFGESLLEAAQSKAVSAVKLQMAFFEALGAEGFAVMKRLVDQAKGLGFFVILDGKRGDISSTMAAYGAMVYEYFSADSMTINPYMGTDVWLALKPWLADQKAEKSAFVVWKTSNPSAALIQDHPDGGESSVAEMLLRRIMRSLVDYPMLPALGVVVGANQIAGLSAPTRRVLAGLPLLVPGVGAQGNTVSDGLTLEAKPWHLWTVSRSLYSGEVSGSARQHFERRIGQFQLELAVARA